MLKNMFDKGKHHRKLKKMIFIIFDIIIGIFYLYGEKTE